MFRKDIQKRLGLTRKALDYYEEKGFIHPCRMENGYRKYSDTDIATLEFISLYRKLGLNLREIREIKDSPHSLKNLLRKKARNVANEKEKQELLTQLAKGATLDEIQNQLAILEKKECLYDRLERAFPGYLASCFFTAYQPFLNETLSEDAQQAFQDYVHYLDQLPELPLTNDERAYIEKQTVDIDDSKLQKLQQQKILAINNPSQWFEDNQEAIREYQSFKQSDDYLNSPLKAIEYKLKQYLLDQNYYNVAIPLLRKISISYDQYYKQLIMANEVFLKAQISKKND